MELNRDALHEALSADERERREESATRRLLKRAQDEKADLERKVDLLSGIDAITVQQPSWAQPTKGRKARRGVANLMLSDLHLDEIVQPEQVRYRNAYNRQIAAQRLKRTSENTIRMARDYLTGITYDGIYLWVNGDLISGNIHEELRRTNAGQDVVDSVDHWVDPLCALVDQLADYFQHVHIVASYGNHGRNHEKPPSKDAVRSSFDWLILRIMHRQLKTDQRVTWNIPEALEVREQQYNTRILMQHGDDFRGGDQIAGAVRPVMMGDYRQLVIETADGDPYDQLLVGHFHQYTTLPRAVINGSLIGYSNYAARKKLRPEPPKQAFWITTPEHGPSFHMPILPMDREAEKW